MNKVFICEDDRAIADMLKMGLEAENLRQLASLCQGFSRYDQSSPSQRQSLVRQLRQGLHQLQPPKEKTDE